MEATMTQAASSLPLTQFDCEQAEPRLVDGKPKTRVLSLGGGLLLQVVPSTVDANGHYSTSKQWLFRYSLDGRERRLGLGAFGKNKDLEWARVRADRLGDDIEQGIDPLEEKREKRKVRERKREARKAGARTFKACADAYIAAHEIGWSSPVYRKQWKDTFAKYVFPVIGNMNVNDVTKADILEILQPLWKKSEHGGRLTTARQLRARIATIFDYAAAQKFRPPEGNPAAWEGNLAFDLAKPSRVKPKRHHPALNYEQIGEVMAKLRQERTMTARCLEFAILTAARSGEARLTKWGEMDFEKRLWTVPAERMKVRHDDRGDHVVPLSDAAMAVLETIKGDGEPDPKALVFTGRWGGRLALTGLWRLCERIHPGIAIHGFRSTFSDWVGDETSASEETREFCLAHIKRGVAGAYRHKTAVEKRRVLLQQWADYCNGVKPAPAKVIPLRRTA
jgi:integrase